MLKTSEYFTIKIVYSCNTIKSINFKNNNIYYIYTTTLFFCNTSIIKNKAFFCST